MPAADPPPFVTRLVQATNAHDWDALAGCFAPGYRNEAPVHPSRNFQGRDQVRANWEQIFRFVPDVHARVLSHAVHGIQVWSEWEMSGTRLDGTRHLMQGVIIFEVKGDQATAARFYLEPVDATSTTGVSGAVSHQVHADGPEMIVPT